MLDKLTVLEKILFSILIIAYILGIYFAIAHYDYYLNGYTAEDNIVEWGTTIALFAICCLCIYRLFIGLPNNSWKGILGTCLFALIFFFGAGEEISWGQRIFNIESSEYFLENNAQEETNLHNLVIGEKSVNKVIFGQLLTISMIIYLLILPVLYRKIDWIKNLVDDFKVPIAQWHHTIIFLAATITTQIMPWSRRWEINELAFGIVFLLIFCYPLNKHIFSKT